MNILFDARPLTIPSPGGVTRLTKSLLETLATSLPSDTCLFGTTGWEEHPLGITLPSTSRRVHARLPNKVVSSLTTLGARSFEQFFPTEKPDLLFFPNNGHVGRPRLPYGLVVHDLSFLVEPRWFNWHGQVWHKIVHAKRLMCGAEKIFAVSEWTKFALTLHLNIPEERIVVLPIPREPAPVSPSALPSELTGKRYALCLGRRDRRKNAHCAVEAVRTLHTKAAYKDLSLVIVGGYDQPLPDPRFIVLPRIEDALLHVLYKYAAVFLYPSWYEGLGLPLHEAALYGTPSVAASTSALPDTAPAGTLFAPPAKPHVWALAMETLLETRSLRTRNDTKMEHQPNWHTAVEPIRSFFASFQRSQS